MSTVEGWETKRFDEIGTIFSGSTPSTSISSFWDGEIVWVTPNDLSKLKTPYLCDSGKRITEKGLNGCSAHLLPAGSLVMSSRAPIGYVALPTVQFCTNQGCKTIKLKSAFHPEFTYYNVLFNIDKVKKLGEGTTFAEITKTALSTVELSFPTSLPEQSKIADILSTVDRAIEQTEALIAKQQRIKTGLMQDLLTHGIDEHGNLRSEQTHQFKDSPLGRIPVGWEVCQWKEIVTNWGYGPRFSAANYSENGNVKTIRGSDFTKDGDVLYSQVPMALLPQIFVARHKLEQNDVVVVTTADCGVTAVFEEQDCDYIASAYAVSYRFNKRVNPHFVKYFMQTDVAKRQVKEYVRQGTLGNLPGSDLLKIWMPLFTLMEQVKHVETLDLSTQSIRKQNDYLSKLRSLKTALMQDLLTGKKRVTALLENIS